MVSIQSSVTKTFGILTAGGDCPGLNAAIRGVCQTAHERYGMHIIGIADGYRGLIDENVRPLKPPDYAGILTRGGTILGASREKPFKAENGDSDKAVGKKVAAIKETYHKLKLDCLVILGGNGTNTTGSWLAQEGLNVIGLPKTIDNDVMGTDLTFGFDSALTICTEAIDRLHTTAESHHRIIVIELMGHKVGWLALYAGVAGGSDVILIPEIPYDIKAIGRHLEHRAKSGKTYSIVAVAEGALSLEEAKMDKHERKKYRAENGPSIAHRLTREISKETGMDTRPTVLGYMQRGGGPSAFDRVLATSFGVAAAELLAKGKYGRMVALNGNEIGSVDLSVPESKVKTVPLNHCMIDTAIAMGIFLGSK
ncbi:MAG: 6-phosphofructokinase [Treponema sp.]|nr:6-phosphofructokinase [Treponema sp.]